MKNFSALILTYNEELNIRNCLSSIRSSNDIVVLDSYSSDATLEIVGEFNARIYQRHFSNYSDQRNYGLHDISYKNEYLLILDADERVSPDLLDELLAVCNSVTSASPDVFFVRRRVLFENKVLAWNYTSSIWIERLVRPKKVKYVGLVHEKVIFNGANGFLRHYIIHDTFSKGVSNWIERRKKYALLDASQLQEPSNMIVQEPTPVSKRMKLKRFMLHRIPFFYVVYFIYNLVFKLAFLDGYRGLMYISLESYSFFLTAKHLGNVKKP